MNKIVEFYDPKNTEFKPVTLTPAAIEHVKKKLKERGKGIGLRFGIKKAGCSGLKYIVDYVDEQQANDHLFPIENNLAIYVDLESLPYVQGTEIDYVKIGITGGELKFNNPNEKNACGCGESFSP